MGRSLNFPRAKASRRAPEKIQRFVTFDVERALGGAMRWSEEAGEPAPVRTLADMSEEEIQAIEKRYGCPVVRPGSEGAKQVAAKARRARIARWARGRAA